MLPDTLGCHKATEAELPTVSVTRSAGEGLLLVGKAADASASPLLLAVEASTGVGSGTLRAFAAAAAAAFLAAILLFSSAILASSSAAVVLPAVTMACGDIMPDLVEPVPLLLCVSPHTRLPCVSESWL